MAAGTESMWRGRGSSWGLAATSRRLGVARAGQERRRGARGGRSERRRGRRRAEEQSESMEDAMARVQRSGPRGRTGCGGGGGGGGSGGGCWVFAGGKAGAAAQKLPAKGEGTNRVAWQRSAVLRGFKDQLFILMIEQIFLKSQQHQTLAVEKRAETVP